MIPDVARAGTLREATSSDAGMPKGLGEDSDRPASRDFGYGSVVPVPGSFSR
jgi:hypothetical protein